MPDDFDPEFRECETVLRALIDGTNDAIFLKDGQSRYVLVNAACAHLLGLPADALVGKDDFELLSENEARIVRAADADVIRTGESRTFEVPIFREGRQHHFQTTKTPFRSRSGEVIGVIGVSRDITEQKAHALASARLAAIVESSADAILGISCDFRIQSWNAAATRMFGYSPEEATGQLIHMIAVPESLPFADACQRRLLAGERIVNLETAAVCKDGTRIPVELTLSPVRDGDGTLVAFSTIAHDITERKATERRLRATLETQNLAVEAAHLGVWCWDIPKGRLEWSPQCKAMHGLRPDEEVTYPRFLEVLHPDDRQRTERAIWHAREQRADYRTEHRVIWPDGSVHWISTSGRVLCDSTGEAERMVGVAFDITSQVRAEEERTELLLLCAQRAREEAQDATRAKDVFLAVLSHELRTPLQSMLGWTQMLRAPGTDGATMQKGLAVLDRNVKMQARIIDDLLDVSRIVSGKIRLSQERIDLVAVVTAAMATAKVPADARSVAIEAGPLCTCCIVLGDAARLEQIVVNLLSNAVKFTPPGGLVRLRLECEDAHARLTVADTGAGITPEFLPHVFDRFRQDESTVKRSNGGLGLGLAIVHHLVELHGGTVSAASAGEGQGATFVMTLPLLDGETS